MSSGACCALLAGTIVVVGAITAADGSYGLIAGT
jgi:hypothetical protein